MHEYPQGPKVDALQQLLGDMNGYFGEYGAEMKSIAEFLGIDLGIVVTLNLSYELRRVSSYLYTCTCKNRYERHI